MIVVYGWFMGGFMVCWLSSCLGGLLCVCLGGLLCVCLGGLIGDWFCFWLGGHTKRC